MTGLAILLLLAAVAMAIARRLRVPPMPILLCCGLGVSASGVAPSRESLLNTLELGLTFLVFAAGVELNPRRFAGQRRPALWVSGVLLLVIGPAGFAIARALGFGPLASLYLALTVSASSTLVALRELRRRQQAFEPFARVVIGVQLIQDFAIIVAIVVLAAIGGGGGGIVVALWRAALLGGFAVVCQRYLLPWLLSRRRPDEETLLLTVLALLFIFAGTAEALGLPVVAGAFLAGFALSAFPLSGIIRGQLMTLSDFFSAIFFTALGASLVIPDSSLLLKALALAALVLIGTPLVAACVAERCGLSSRAAIDCGLLLAQTGEFSLVLGLTGVHLGHVGDDAFAVIAILAVATMTLMPVVATDRITRRLLHWHPIRRRMSVEGTRRGHVLLLGFGAAGMWIFKPLRAAGHEVLVVDDDPVVIDQLRKSGIPCLPGDGSDEKTLQRAGAREAKLIIVSMRRTQDAATVMRHAAGVPVVTRVFETSDAEAVAMLGGIPILNSSAAGEAFMEWFEKSGKVVPARAAAGLGKV